MTTQEYEALKTIAYGKDAVCPSLLRNFLDEVSVEEAQETPEIGQNAPNKGTRTQRQNNSIHLWLTQLAEELDRHGHTIQNVVAKIQRAEIRPTGEALKEVLWRPYQIAAFKKESTTQLNKSEVDRVYEGLNKFLGENFEIHVPFPSDENRAISELQGVKIAQTNNLKNLDYKDMDDTNNADKF